jgi:hypothetical protein
LSNGVCSALCDIDEERAETEGTGTAAQSPPEDACRGSCSSFIDVGGKLSTGPNRTDADDVEENVYARGKA